MNQIKPAFALVAILGLVLIGIDSLSLAYKRHGLLAVGGVLAQKYPGDTIPLDSAPTAANVASIPTTDTPAMTSDQENQVCQQKKIEAAKYGQGISPPKPPQPFSGQNVTEINKCTTAVFDKTSAAAKLPTGSGYNPMEDPKAYKCVGESSKVTIAGGGSGLIVSSPNPALPPGTCETTYCNSLGVCELVDGQYNLNGFSNTSGVSVPPPDYGDASVNPAQLGPPAGPTLPQSQSGDLWGTGAWDADPSQAPLPHPETDPTGYYAGPAAENSSLSQPTSFGEHGNPNVNPESSGAVDAFGKPCGASIADSATCPSSTVGGLAQDGSKSNVDQSSGDVGKYNPAQTNQYGGPVAPSTFPSTPHPYPIANGGMYPGLGRTYGGFGMYQQPSLLGALMGGVAQGIGMGVGMGLMNSFTSNTSSNSNTGNGTKKSAATKAVKEAKISSTETIPEKRSGAVSPEVSGNTETNPEKRSADVQSGTTETVPEKRSSDTPSAGVAGATETNPEKRSAETTPGGVVGSTETPPEKRSTQSPGSDLAEGEGLTPISNTYNPSQATSPGANRPLPPLFDPSTGKYQGAPLYPVNPSPNPYYTGKPLPPLPPSPEGSTDKQYKRPELPVRPSQILPPSSSAIQTKPPVVPADIQKKLQDAATYQRNELLHLQIVKPDGSREDAFVGGGEGTVAPSSDYTKKLTDALRAGYAVTETHTHPLLTVVPNQTQRNAMLRCQQQPPPMQPSASDLLRAAYMARMQGGSGFSSRVVDPSGTWSYKVDPNNSVWQAFEKDYAAESAKVDSLQGAARQAAEYSMYQNLAKKYPAIAHMYEVDFLPGNIRPHIDAAARQKMIDDLAKMGVTLSYAPHPSGLCAK